MCARDNIDSGEGGGVGPYLGEKKRNCLTAPLQGKKGKKRTPAIWKKNCLGMGLSLRGKEKGLFFWVEGELN